MKNYFALLPLAACVACGPMPQTDAMNSDDILENIVENSAADGSANRDEVPAGKWSYSEDKDEMRGATTYFAKASANDPVNLGFPYGISTPELTLRKSPKFGTDVYVTIDGQFTCDVYSNDTIAAKFDSGPIVNFGCAEPDDGTTGILFIQGASKFINKLKSSKKVTLEVPVYQAGRQQWTFEIEGLEWKR